MRIAFFMSRANQLRVHGPVIRAAAKRGHECHFLVSPDVPLLGTMPCPVEPLLHSTQVAAFQVLVGVGMLPHPMLSAARLAAPKTLFCALPYLQEELLRIKTDGSCALALWDIVGTGSQEGLDCLVEHLGWPTLTEAWLRQRVIPVGSPLLDGLEGMDSSACREKHGLPVGQPLLCFGTAARPHLLGKWRVRAYMAPSVLPAELLGDVSYLTILRAVRRYADRHGAFVIAKTRDKHRDPHYVRRYVDRLISDESHWPATTLEVLMASHLYVGIASAMSIEAAACGVPQYTFLPYDLVRAEHPLYLPFRRRFYLQAGGLWNSTSLMSQCFDLRRTLAPLYAWRDMAPWPTGPTALASLYRLTGPPGASDRFLDLVEARL